MKLTSSARSFVNTVLSDAEHGNEEIRVALAYAIAVQMVSNNVNNNEEIKDPKRMNDFILARLNSINQFLILKYNLEDTVRLTISFIRWRSSVGAVGPFTPKSYENLEYPLAGILGISGHVSNDIIKTLCHPKLPTYLAGWSEVLKCD